MDGGYKAHLDLLRKEHLALNGRYGTLLRNYDLLTANSGTAGQHGLASRLVHIVKGLCGKPFLSDITISVGDRQLPGHKFVILARSSYWKEMDNVETVSIEGFSHEEFETVYAWMYTDVLDSSIDDSKLTKVAEIASAYEFFDLQNVCTTLLTARLDISNCVMIFEFAEKENLVQLRDNCADLVAARWNEFTREHFACLSATLLYKLLKGHSANVLQSIIQLEREDVLFLYFIENDENLKSLLNDSSVAPCALETALSLSTFALADELRRHGADVNLHYEIGDKNTLLMRMIDSGNIKACRYLIEHGAAVCGIQDPQRMLSPIQFIARAPLTEELLSLAEEIAPKCDINHVSRFKGGEERTSLVAACLNESDLAQRLVVILLNNSANPNINDGKGKSALYHSIVTVPRFDIALKLIENGADKDVVVYGEPLIHAVADLEDSFMFLLEKGPYVDAENSKGSSLLHCIVHRISEAGKMKSGTEQLVAVLKAGANPNVSDSEGNSPLHVVIKNIPAAVDVFIKHSSGLNWKLKDGSGRSPLKLALIERQFEAAASMIQAGAPVNEEDVADGDSLLLAALKAGNDNVAVFLLTHKADYIAKDKQGRTPLEISLSVGLCGAVRTLCGAGVNLNERTDGGTGFVVLERALSAGHIDCAALLVSFGCDVESWTWTDDCEETLLHFMMDQGHEDAAVFLIEHGSDVNARKRYRRETDDDGQYPIHMAVGYGLQKVVKALIDKDTVLTNQDTDGRTACHVAVREGNRDALRLLLAASDVSFISTRDKVGQTPLSLAIARRDHKAAAEIVNRQPHAALQTNGNGENLLHVAVRSNDLESVLFLLGTHTDPTRTTQDASRRTALHMAAQAANELIMRNLILAGCVVDARTSDGSTPLHEVVRAQRADLVAILLENNANANITDEKGDNALLCAVRSGSVSCVRTMVQYPRVETRAVNTHGKSALHVCASLPAEKMEKGSSAAELCELLLAVEGNRLAEKDLAVYVDARDADGNTALLSAYISGNAGVCRSLLRRGAAMGSRNAEGVTVFTHETPTKQLLFGLLESLEREPRWSEGDACDCGAKFSITQRKHHCRHCGRVVCSPCSVVSMPIAKFGEEKKVRVCSMCTLVLTQGVPR